MDDDRNPEACSAHVRWLQRPKAVKEAKLPIRVLATIPDLAPPPAQVVARPRAGNPERTRSTTAATRTDDGAEPENSVRKRSIRPAERPRFRRRTSKGIFPSGSITVLAVIAVAIWSYVAVRDMRRPHPGPAGDRIAAESASIDKGTTRR